MKPHTSTKLRRWDHALFRVQEVPKSVKRPASAIAAERAEELKRYSTSWRFQLRGNKPDIDPKAKTPHN